MSSPADFPSRPPSEIEWEELLVHYEIGPRALRIAVEDSMRAAATEPFDLGLRLFDVVLNEYWTGTLFSAMRTGEKAEWSSVPQFDAVPPVPPFELMDWLARLRASNFATVQRRGLEVWDWRTDLEGGEITAHQQIKYAVALDGETLAAIRAASREAGR
jgi:hypothetical protein